MPATVTLTTTTILGAVGPGDSRISLASTAGLTKGLLLYVDGELMMFQRVEIDPWVIVTRGVENTAGVPHASGTLVYIGRADQFYDGPPMGTPLGTILVSPYIDTVNSKVYFAQGDASSTSNRFWQVATTTYDVGPLGVRTVTVDPSSST